MQLLVWKMNGNFLPADFAEKSEELAPKSIELLRLRILCQTPAPEILNRKHRGQTSPIMLRSHKNSAARRAVVSLVNGPNLRARFEGIHAPVLRKGWQLRPNISSRATIADLENRMLQGFIAEL